MKTLTCNGCAYDGACERQKDKRASLRGARRRAGETRRRVLVDDSHRRLLRRRLPREQHDSPEHRRAGDGARH